MSWLPTGSLQPPSTAWVAEAIAVPCPACGLRVRLADPATASGRAALVAALHDLPACDRFLALDSFGAIAAYVREIAEATP